MSQCGGPVPASGHALGVDFWRARDTYLRAVQTYADQSQLVEMLLIVNPVLPDLTVQSRLGFGSESTVHLTAA